MRDMKKRAVWEKHKYTRFVANISKDDGEIFKSSLRKSGETFQGWLKKKVNDYLKE